MPYIVQRVMGLERICHGHRVPDRICHGALAPSATGSKPLTRPDRRVLQQRHRGMIRAGLLIVNIAICFLLR
jgi:hypothetical protein